MQSRNLNLHCMLSLSTKIFSSHLLCYMANAYESTALSGLLQASTQQTFILLPSLCTTDQKSSVLFFLFFPQGNYISHQGPGLLSFSSICPFQFLFLLWCLQSFLTVGLLLFSMPWCFPSLNVLPFLSHPLQFQHGFPSHPNLMKDSRFSPVIHSGDPKLLAYQLNKT